jgi:hypothetical protein
MMDRQTEPVREHRLNHRPIFIVFERLRRHSFDVVVFAFGPARTARDLKVLYIPSDLNTPPSRPELLSLIDVASKAGAAGCWAKVALKVSACNTVNEEILILPTDRYLFDGGMLPRLVNESFSAA